MSEKLHHADALSALGQRRAGRRAALTTMGLTALGAGTTALVGRGAHATDEYDMGMGMGMPGPSDADVLNFALNLEYLEAEYYLRAIRGFGLNPMQTTGVGMQGDVTGGREVEFETPIINQYAREIALDEAAHVQFLRSALGEDAVARPEIDLDMSFTAAAQAAGLIGMDQTFDAFANENNFLLGAFLFEDVGVTAYKGAARFIDNKDFLEAAAGILAVEAYHASNVRTVLLSRDLIVPANAISDARDSLDGPEDLDQGITTRQRGGLANIVPADDNGIAFSRTPGQVLNIVYLSPETMPGGFFPNGLNGAIR